MLAAATLDRIVHLSHRQLKVRKDELRPGDCVVIRTLRSKYMLKVLTNGLFEVRGGWFDEKCCAPMRIGVAGATWGGSTIMPQVLAAVGMSVEFRNRVITGPVRSIVVWPERLLS